LNDSSEQLGDREAMLRLSKADHQRFFTAFVATLLDDFSRYLDAREVVDMEADGVGYHKFALYLSDAEMAELAAAMNRAFAVYMDPKEKSGRKKRLFTSIVMPDASGEESERG